MTGLLEMGPSFVVQRSGNIQYSFLVRVQQDSFYFYGLKHDIKSMSHVIIVLPPSKLKPMGLVNSQAKCLAVRIFPKQNKTNFHYTFEKIDEWNSFENFKNLYRNPRILIQWKLILMKQHYKRFESTENG